MQAAASGSPPVLAERPVLMQPPAAGEVHVWRFSLAVCASRAARLEHVLSAAENARAARFRFERDRQRFVVGRALYRGVLARYAGVSPAALPLTSVFGEKPGCEIAPCAHNLSHAHELGLLAVAASGELGVDVDFIERQVDLRTIAPSALTPREHAAWKALSSHEQRPAFFSVWTRKEAVLKATGDRKAFEFREFEVGLRADAIATAEAARA